MNMNVIMWNKVLANGIQQSVKKDDDQVRYISQEYQVGLIFETDWVIFHSNELKRKNIW